MWKTIARKIQRPLSKPVALILFAFIVCFLFVYLGSFGEMVVMRNDIITGSNKIKKLRGWKNKKREADFNRLEVARRKVDIVSISDITTDGFWLHTPKKDYYISRAIFHWFQGASDYEIQDVFLTQRDDEFGGDMLWWRKLDLLFSAKSIAARITKFTAKNNAFC